MRCTSTNICTRIFYFEVILQRFYHLQLSLEDRYHWFWRKCCHTLELSQEKIHCHITISRPVQVSYILAIILLFLLHKDSLNLKKAKQKLLQQFFLLNDYRKPKQSKLAFKTEGEKSFLIRKI